MATHPLAFSEVLEDEYRYLFGEVRYGAIKFERKHVRELGDLARRIEIAASAPEQSRWHVLAEAVANVKADGGSASSDREQVILDALNAMIGDPGRGRYGDPKLLNKLLTRDDDHRHFRQKSFAEQITAPEVWRALLAVPVARRLVLVEPKLFPAVAADPDLIVCFSAQSAAIRLLLAEGMEPAFRAYPALLSTIADDGDLEGMLVQDAATEDGMTARQRRDVLRTFFEVKPRNRLLDWLRAHGPRRYRRAPSDDAVGHLTQMSYSNANVRAIVAGREGDPMAPAQQIAPEHLASFNAILIETAYCAYVADRQKVRSLYGAIHDRTEGLAALCLSGGGIRSATFNLGILQGLADHRVLNRLHYLSTVSGGGYIGSWLSSWMRRHHEGAVGVAKDLSRQPSDPLQPEVRPIRHLREYSAYLAPRSTAFSLDSWSLVTTYVRNLLLNWTMLIPALAAALAMPRLFQAAVCTAANSRHTWPSAGTVAVVLAVTAAMVVGWVRPATPFSGRGAKRHGDLAMALWVVPLILSGFLFCIYWAHRDNAFYQSRWVLPAVFAAGSLLGALGFAFHLSSASQPLAIGAKAKVQQLQAFLLWLVRLHQFGKRGWAEMGFAVLSGAAGGWILRSAFIGLFRPETLATHLRMELYVCFGVPLYLAVFFVEATLLVGFTTSWCRDYDREWWARGAAALYVYSAVHALGVFAVMLVPLLIFELPAYVAPLGGLSAIGTWLLPRLAKTSSIKKDSARVRWLMPLLQVAAAVALLLVIAGISILTSQALAWLDNRAFGTGAATGWLGRFPSVQHVDALFHRGTDVDPKAVLGHVPTWFADEFVHVLRATHVATLIVFTLVAFLGALFMSRVLNVNVYSLHGMYRNRLIRAYLGASRWERHPDSFTGFDPQDNVEMWKLRPQFIWPSSFLDFPAFAKTLGATSWWTSRAITAPQVLVGRSMLAAYLAAGDDKKPLLDGETRTAVADAVNELMRTRDLRHDVEAPSTLRLLDDNRAYLEETFPSLRKREKAELAPADAPLVIPEARISREGVEMPHALIDRCASDPGEVRATPPLHVLNTALNLVHGDNLAWQERKAASFTISPLHSGSRILAYRDSAEYARGRKAGISLGTAMAISGAAVSPNRGAESSPIFTFLMTLFNARLGWWFGNPTKETYRAESPKKSIVSLLREAIGRTDRNHDYIYLSDGGHFDNLGLYEMVLRRCRYIIVCDATADSGFGFGDLANAVRKVRIDLGVPIEPLVTKYIGPQKDERYAKFCAFGHIRYQDVDGGGEENMGYLLYIKPCVFSECPADVRNYAKEHTTFPHETTIDQFFSESQFESYRALGRYIIGRICGDRLGAAPCLAPNVPVFFANAWAYVHEGVPPVGDAPVEHVSDVVKWMQVGLS